MAMFEIAEAQERLSELIDRALAGEEIVITRDGLAVVTVRPVKAAATGVGRAPSQADIDWLLAHRVGKVTSTMDAGTLVSRMRDEDDERFTTA